MPERRAYRLPEMADRSGRGSGRMTRDACPTCGQLLPRGEYLTDRELDVLVAWWMTRSVRKAAAQVGVGEQRAKNLLMRARKRNGVRSNDVLLAAHLDAVRSRLLDAGSHNIRRGAA